MANAVVTKIAGKNFTLAQFARRIGEAMGTSSDLSQSEAFHRAYKALGDDEDAKQVKADMVRTYVIEYAVGRADVDAKTVASNYDKPRAKRAKAIEKLINAGLFSFRYHVSRTGKKGKGKAREQAAPVKLSRDVKAAAMEFVAEFEGDDLNAQVKSAIAALRALVA